MKKKPNNLVDWYFRFEYLKEKDISTLKIICTQKLKLNIITSFPLIWFPNLSPEPFSEIFLREVS